MENKALGCVRHLILGFSDVLVALKLIKIKNNSFLEDNHGVYKMGIISLELELEYKHCIFIILEFRKCVQVEWNITNRVVVKELVKGIYAIND